MPVPQNSSSLFTRQATSLPAGARPDFRLLLQLPIGCRA